MHTFFARKSCKQISAISSKVLSSCRVREYTADSPVSSFLSIMEKVSVKAALIDLSGTLHIEDVATDGAQAALKRLQDHGVLVKFVTNTTKEPLRLLYDRLCRLGFQVNKDDIFTSLTAAKALVTSKQLRPLLMLEKCAKEDFEGVSEDNPNAVVVGLAPTCFDYGPMNNAFQLLLTGVPLIAIHKGRYFRKKDGLYLGPGAFVAALEYAADTKAEVVGKPEEIFFLEAIRGLNADPAECVMIGDDVHDDIAGAMRTGMMGILVKTGKYREGDENKIMPTPTAVCTNFCEAVDLICKNNDFVKNTGKTS